MNKEYTCIICPNGCDIMAQLNGTEIISLEGALCKRGWEYIEQELNNPKRNIASSVAVVDGEFPLASVRLSNSIPKARIFDVMEQIRSQHLTAPVNIGDIVIENVLGLDSNVIITKQVAAQKI